MKQILILLTMTLFFSCQEKNENTQKVAVKTVQKDKYKDLLAKFKNIAIDTLVVYSAEEDFGKYKGIRIDSLDATLFPENIAKDYLLEHDIFACYKFDINSSKIGLIARTPSEYVPSSIKLFVYDKTKNTISQYIELAENWGDAGESWVKTSWIIKNKGNQFRVLIEEDENYDHSAEDINDTIVESSEKHYLLELSSTKLDTINKNSEVLKKQFYSILNKKLDY